MFGKVRDPRMCPLGNDLVGTERLKVQARKMEILKKKKKLDLNGDFNFLSPKTRKKE